MCGRFAQYSSRDDYFDALGIGPEELTRDAEPIGRYNVAPGTKVLLLSERDGELKFDPVYWGYGPEWWDKPPLINARSETAATGRSPCGNTGGPLCRHRAGLSGKKAVPGNSPTSFITETESRFFLRPSGSRLLTGSTGRRVSSSSPQPAIRGWSIYTIAVLSC